MRALLAIALIGGPALFVAGCQGGSGAQALAATPESEPATPRQKTPLEPGAPKRLAIFFEVSNRGELDPCG